MGVFSSKGWFREAFWRVHSLLSVDYILLNMCSSCILNAKLQRLRNKKGISINSLPVPARPTPTSHPPSTFWAQRVECLLFGSHRAVPICVFSPQPAPASLLSSPGSQDPRAGNQASDSVPVESCVVMRMSLCFLCLSRPLPADVDVIAKFAQLEFQLGDAERARAIFESTLSIYPKRTDVWSVYIDMIIKHGSQKEAR